MAERVSAGSVITLVFGRLFEGVLSGSKPMEMRNHLRLLVEDEPFWAEVLRQQRLVERHIATGRTTVEREQESGYQAILKLRERFR